MTSYDAVLGDLRDVLCDAVSVLRGEVSQRNLDGRSGVATASRDYLFAVGCGLIDGHDPSTLWISNLRDAVQGWVMYGDDTLPESAGVAALHVVRAVADLQDFLALGVHDDQRY